MNFSNFKIKIKNFFTKRIIIISSLSLILVVCLIFTGLQLKKYINLKHEKNVINATLELPNVFYQDDYIPNIFIDFAAPVVKLESTEKSFKEGIKIEPKISGDFIFVSPTYLKFVPTSNWKPGTEYKIIFSKKFEKFKNLKRLEYRFNTTPNKPYILNYEFYENPKNIKERKVVGSLIFSYPVELKDIEKNISLTSENGKLKFNLKFGDTKKVVVVESEVISIKDKEDYIVFSYDFKGDEIKDRIRIPSAKDYFKFSSIRGSTIFNPDNQEEEQIITLSFTRPVNVQDVINILSFKISNGSCYQGNLKKLNEKSRHLDFKNLTVNEKYSKHISLKIDVFDTNNSCILASLDGKQITSEDGYILNDNEVKITGVPSFTKDVNVVFDGVIVNSDNNKTLSFVSRGYDSLKVEINRLNKDSINHLITQTSGDFKSADFINSYSFNEDNISEKFDEIISLQKMHPAKSNYSSISLKKYTDVKKGVFIVKVNGYDTKYNRILGSGDRRMIIVTDIGIMVKTNSNETKDVFVSSLSKGTPIEKAKVEIVGKNGLAIATKFSDAKGHVSFSSLKNFTKEKQPVAYIVTYGDDVSFIPYKKYDRELNYSRFNVGGVYQDNRYGTNLKSYIFTDRDLYRPGETVEIAFILKDKNLSYLSADMPLEVVIRDDSYNEISVQRLKNGSGFFDLRFETDTNIQTGEYTIYLYLINNKGRRDLFLSSKSIRIEEFQPDRMKISIAFDDVSKNGWYNKDVLKGEVKLENLFGAPAQNRIMKTTVEIKPINFYFQEYKNYKFTDLWKENIYKTQNIVEERPEMETDENGILKFDVNLSKYTNGTYSLNFTAEGFEPDGGRSVIDVKSLLVSPLKYIVGYKTNSDLNYIKKDTEHTIDLIALDNKLNKTNIDNLKLVLRKISFESVLTQDSTGLFRYQKEKTYKDISVDELKISKDGTSIKLPSSIVGEMQMTILDQNDKELSVINYNVVGQTNSTFSIDKNAELKLILDKKEYKSGETIEMSITAPYVGYGLITIERDKIYAFKWFKATTNNTVQTITIPENIDGNAYINVSFMRDINSKEVFVSPLSYAVAPFNINKSKFEVKIGLDVPVKVKPGDVLNIGYSLNKNADIVVYGVDEGILQVAGYKLPDPLSEFTKKIALQVVTSQIFDLVLPSFEIIKEAAGIGGGEYYDEVIGNLNPFARKLNKPTVFWSGILKDRREGVYSYKIPDYFNGKMRIMAVAVGDGTFGSSQTFVNSQADIVLLPNVPVNLSPNDEIDITVGVGNYIEESGKNAELSITAEASTNLQIIGDNNTKIIIPENYEKTASFRIKALEKLGNAEVKFIAKCEKCKNTSETKVVSTISIRPSSPYQVLIDSGMAKSIVIKDIKELFNEYADSKLFVSGSPIVLTQGLFDFLDEFPHGCSEQITSKVFASMLIKSKYSGLIKGEKFDKLLENTLTELAQRQNNDGGFFAWSPNSNYFGGTNNFHTLYVMHFLTLAKKNNYYISQNMFDRGIEWIKDFISKTPDNLEDAKNMAYGIYILTLNDILPTANIVSLENIINTDYKDSWEKTSIGLYMASSYKLMQEDKKADEIIKKYKIQNTDKYYGSYDSDDIRNVQYIYLTGLHFPEIFNKIRNESSKILLDIVKGRRYNTLLSSYSIMALTNFAESTTVENISFTVKDKSDKMLINKIINTPFTTLVVPNSGISEISFKNNEELYYSFIQKGFGKTSSQKAFSKNIEVIKKITNLDGKDIKTVKQGEEVLISVKIQNLKKDYIENLAIVDLLPSGFEIKEVVTAEGVFSFNLREDRFLGYAWLSSNGMVEIVYKAKVTTKGKIVVPAVFVQDLYNNDNQAQSNSSEFVVN